MLRTVADNLWTWDEPHRVGGLEIGARMTLVRLPDGALWVHSPLTPAKAMREALDKLGEVRYVVVPNTMHYLGVKEFAAAYTKAKIYAAPGLVEAGKDIPYHDILGDAPEDAWVEVFEQMIFRGNSLTEAVFLHRATRTLILTDTSHFLTGGNALTRLYAKISAVQDKPGPTVIWKMVTRDHKAARASLERMLNWDFDRVIVAHGDIYESGGQAALREKFAWLMDKERG
jgi:hypothetical protein